MQATEQNLARVGDIITELERQLSSLRRHAKKAERYRKLGGSVTLIVKSGVGHHGQMRGPGNPDLRLPPPDPVLLGEAEELEGGGGAGLGQAVRNFKEGVAETDKETPEKIESGSVS